MKVGQKARRVSAQTGVMLSGDRQRIDGLLGDHGLNRGLSLDEPAPTDLGAQHLDCVALIGVGLHQDAQRVAEEPQRRRRLLTAALVALFASRRGAREETADLLAEHMDGLVRQPFLQIDEIGEKRGAPAIGAKILGEPSRRGVALAHNLLPAVGMNRLPARRVHRQAAQKIKTIEKAVEIGGARRIRPTAEPAKSRLADCRIERQQRVERRHLCGRPPIQYRLKSALARNGAPRAADPIHALGRGSKTPRSRKLLMMASPMGRALSVAVAASIAARSANRRSSRAAARKDK